MHTNRLFIAISIPDAVKDDVEKVQMELRRGLAGAEVGLTKRAHFQSRLQFMGHIGAEYVH